MNKCFLEKVEHMVWFYEQKACLFWCCANGLPLTPFTLFFPCNTSAHTHLPPTLHTSTLQHHEYIHEWKSVERNTMHQTQHTSFLSIRQMRMEKTLKDDTSWTADCSLFFSPLRKGKKIKKCKRKHQRLSKKIHLQCYLKCKNEKLQTQTAFRRHS